MNTSRKDLFSLRKRIERFYLEGLFEEAIRETKLLDNVQLAAWRAEQASDKARCSA